MNRLLVAFKAFWKAWNAPQEGQSFIANAQEGEDHSHLHLLAYLQETSRLLDFFKEDLQAVSDAQIGAAARKIQKDCAKAIEECVTVRPLLEVEEGSSFQVPAGFDPREIKLLGVVKGQPPYQGTVIHRGWKCLKATLPKKLNTTGETFLAPAEIEIKR